MVSASSRTVILSDICFIVRLWSVSVKKVCRFTAWQVSGRGLTINRA